MKFLKVLLTFQKYSTGNITVPFDTINLKNTILISLKLQFKKARNKCEVPSNKSF